MQLKTSAHNTKKSPKPMPPRAAPTTARTAAAPPGKAASPAAMRAREAAAMAPADTVRTAPVALRGTKRRPQMATATEARAMA